MGDNQQFPGVGAAVPPTFMLTIPSVLLDYDIPSCKNHHTVHNHSIKATEFWGQAQFLMPVIPAMEEA